MNNEINVKAAREPRIVELRQFVSNVLSPRVNLFVGEMTDHLFNLSSSAQLSSEERARCFEAFSTMQSQQRAITKDIHAHLDRGFDHLVEIQQDGNALPVALDLVDIDEFEDDLAIDRIVRSGSERYWVALESMTLRIGEIVTVDPRKIRLPFSLRALCVAYRSALKPFDFDKKIVLELDRAFARNLLAELSAIYADINKQLAGQGVLPDVETIIERSGSQLHSNNQQTTASQTTNTPANTLQVDGGASQQHSAHPENQPERLHAQADQTVAKSTMSNTTASLNSAIDYINKLAAASNANSPQTAPTPTANTLFPSDEGDTLIAQAQRLDEVQTQPVGNSADSPALREQALISGLTEAVGALRNATQPNALDAAATEGNFPDYLPGRGIHAQESQINAAVLSRLQQNIYGGNATPNLDQALLAANAQALSDNIARLRSSGAIATAAAGPLVEQLALTDATDEAIPLRSSVQMVDDLYQTIQTRLPANSKLYEAMDLIKLPLAQISLVDPQFFLNREHPARLLVERLNELAVLSPAQNPQIEKQVKRILTSVNSDFDSDLNVFDKALEQVTELALKMLRQQQRNIQRQVAAEEGRERRVEAQKHVELELLNALPDVKLPKSLLRVVNSLWRDHLIVQVIRDDDPIEKGVKLLSEVNNLLQTKHSATTDIAPSEVARLIDGLRAAAEESAFLTSDQAEDIVRVEQALSGNAEIDLIDSTIGERQGFEEPQFSEKLQSLPRLRRWVREARDLKKNTWFTDTTSDGVSYHLQLIWSNPSKTRFAFANEQGRKARDVNLVQLARWLGQHLKPLKPSEQLSIIERSVFSTLERQQQQLAEQLQPPSVNELTRGELVDKAQSVLRRARRRGASHTAIAVHSEQANDTQQLIIMLQQANVAVTAAGPLSESTQGILAESATIETIQTVLSLWLDHSTTVGIGISTIDADQNSAEDLWRLLEETAIRGLALSPNTSLIAEREVRSADLNAAVRNTFLRLQDDMPPRVSLIRITRTPAAHPDKVDESFQILLDGMTDAGGEISAQSGHYSAALAVALDYLKVRCACKLAERLAAEGRETPVFNIAVSTDAALHFDFVEFVLNEVSESGIGTNRLCFEFRDSTRLRQESIAADFARALRSIGCLITVRDVNPSRGSTAELQSLSPHVLALDSSLWPPESDAENTSLLHQAISDLHHLVGEYVVLCDDSDRNLAGELGIDFIEVGDPKEISTEELVLTMPLIIR